MKNVRESKRALDCAEMEEDDDEEEEEEGHGIGMWCVCWVWESEWDRRAYEKFE